MFAVVSVCCCLCFPFARHDAPCFHRTNLNNGTLNSLEYSQFVKFHNLIPVLVFCPAYVVSTATVLNASVHRWKVCRFSAPPAGLWCSSLAGEPGIAGVPLCLLSGWNAFNDGFLPCCLVPNRPHDHGGEEWRACDEVAAPSEHMHGLAAGVSSVFVIDRVPFVRLDRILCHIISCFILLCLFDIQGVIAGMPNTEQGPEHWLGARGLGALLPAEEFGAVLING